jgi:hypothetical protein
MRSNKATAFGPKERLSHGATILNRLALPGDLASRSERSSQMGVVAEQVDKKTKVLKDRGSRNIEKYHPIENSLWRGLSIQKGELCVKGILIFLIFKLSFPKVILCIRAHGNPGGRPPSKESMEHRLSFSAGKVLVSLKSQFIGKYLRIRAQRIPLFGFPRPERLIFKITMDRRRKGVTIICSVIRR